MHNYKMDDMKKALEMGMITKKQMNNLPPALLEAIVKKKMKDGGGSHKMADGSEMTGKVHNKNSKPVKKKKAKKKKK